MKKHYIALLGLVCGFAFLSNHTLAQNAPVANQDAAATLVNTQVIVNNVISNDTDVQGNNTINAATVDLNPSSNGRQTSITNSSGTWTVDNSANITYTPANNFNGVGTVNYVVQDTEAAPRTSNSTTVNVKVAVYPPTQPSSDPFTLFTDFPRVKLYNWADPFLSYEYQSPYVDGLSNLRFRLMKPNGYAVGAGPKYPLIIFLHGSGEAGSSYAAVQNNELQLVHGGQTHMNAVNNGTFPGFLLYPQLRKTPFRCGESGQPSCNVNWNPNWREAVRGVIDVLINNYDVDPSRIYIHGLSGGGQGTWQFISDFPDYFAAAHPMSAAGSSFWAGEGDMTRYIHIPLRHSQGGLDPAPNFAAGNAQVEAIRNYGGSLRYSYYPSLGHNTWNSEYVKPDFFSWFLSKNKANIFVYYEQSSYCSTEPISATNTVKLGFSRTINASGLGLFGGSANPNRIVMYEWSKDNPGAPLIASGATTNEITVSAAGTYYGRYQRVNGTWTNWTSVTLDNNRGPSTTPTITANGKSVTLPSLDGSAEVLLYGPSSLAAYDWRRNGSTSVGTNVTYAASIAGTYTLLGRDPSPSPYEADGITPKEFRPAPLGCLSNPSAPIVVTTTNGPSVPAPPDNFFAGATSGTSITISWEDRSNNETGFELYRSATSPSAGYVLVSIIAGNASVNRTYNDTNLTPNTTYYYRMRAVNTDGGSAYTPVAQATTVVDNTAPTAPIVTAGSSSRTVINLVWSGATDNIGVKEYDVYQNGSLIATTTATTYAVTSVVAFTQYYFTVKARDAAGNVSPSSNQVTAAAVNMGLFYSYYHHNGLTSTTQIVASSTLVKTGIISTFSTSPQTRSTNHAFIYDGFINIPTAGAYTFYTTSDDGSQLFIDNNAVALVNNDGSHGDQERSGAVTFPPGSYPQAIPIKVTYFQGTGGASLTVRWQGPSITKQTIPASALSDNYTPPTGPTAPTTNSFRLQVSQPNPNPTYDRVWLQWTDASSNETGFEISRIKTNNGSNGSYSGSLPSSFPVVATVAANTTSFNDTGLESNTRYYYRIRSINNSGASAWVDFRHNGSSGGNNYIITTVAPAAPAVPSPLVANAASATQVNLSWTNVSGETGYEIQKSSNATTGFVSIGTTAADVTSFADNQAIGHTTLYYKVRALGSGTNHSAYTDPASSATTPNRAPAITAIADQAVLASSTTNININITDADLDPLTVNFNFSGVQPDSYNFNSNGYGQGVLSVTYGATTGSSTVTILADDGIDNATGDNNFILTVGNNQAPVITAVSVNGTAVTPAPSNIPNQNVEEGRTLTLAITVQDLVGNTTMQTPVLTLPAALQAPGLVTTNWPGSGNPRIYTITFNTNVGDIGIYENIKVRFSDGAGGVNDQTFSLIITPVDKDFKIYVNFARAATHFETGVWNNTGNKNQVLANLKDDTQNILKYITLTTSNGWDNDGLGYVTLPTTPNPVYTQKVRESHYRSVSNSVAGIPTLFSNLNKALKYRAVIYAGSTDGALAAYRIIGSTTPADVQLASVNNISQTVTTDWVFPDANGVVQVRSFSASFTAARIYLSSIVLEAQYVNTNVAPETPLDLAANAPVHNQVVLTWDDISFNETGFRIFRSTSPSGPWVTPYQTVAQNLETYTDTNVTGRTTYYYRVAAYNNIGQSAQTSTVIVTTPNGIPTIAPITSQTVRVNELLQLNFSATDPENDALTFTLLNNPGFANLVDNGNGTGFISFAPNLSQAGLYSVTLKVTDNLTATSQVTFQLQVIDTEYDQVVYINFNNSASSNAPAPWNNKIPGGVPAVAPGASLVKSDGTASAITVLKSGTWTSFDGGNASGGVNTGNNSGVYPDNAIKSNWTTTALDNNNAGNTTDDTNTIILSNLTSTKRYNITIIGSKDEFFYANTIYTLSPTSGPTAKSINNMKNKNKVVRFSGVVPNGSNQIIISVKKAIGASAATTNRDAVISAMVVEEYSVGTIPRRPTNLVARGWSRSSTRLTWNDNSSDETGFEIHRATDPAGPFTLLTSVAANTEFFVHGSLSPNQAFVYRVRAVKGGNSSNFTSDATASSFSEAILLNVDPNGQINGGIAPAPWNNATTGDPGTGTVLFTDMKNDLNATTTVDVEIVDSGNSSPENSNGILGVNYTSGFNQASTPVASSFSYPAQVQRDFIYWVPNDGPGIIRLNQLDPTKVYDLLFYTHEWDISIAGGVLGTDYTVGSETQTLFNGLNTTETANFYGVTPEEDGTLTFQIKANTSTFAGAWSALQINAYTPLTTTFDVIAPSVPTGLVASEITDESVRLSWNPSTDNVGIGGYEVFQGSTLVATINDTTTVISNLQPLTAYTFSVRSYDIKGNRSSLSTPIQVTTLNSSDEVTFYYPVDTDLTQLASWNTEADGSGSSPVAFTNSNNQHFLINGPVSLDGDLTISGTNSRVIVQTGQTLTLNAVLTALVDTETSAIIEVNSASSPQFGTLAATSTVSFSGNPNAIPGASYGNLLLSGSNSAKNFSTGTYQVNGDLEIMDNVSLVGSTGNGTTLSIAGNLTINGSPVMPADNQLFSVNFTGATPTLTGNSVEMRFAQLSVSNNAQLNVVNLGETPNTLTLGTPTGGGLTINNGSTLDLGENNLVISGQGSVNPANQTGALKVSLADITVNSSGSQTSNLYFVTDADTVKNLTLNTANSAQVNIRTKMNVREHLSVNTGHISSAGNIVLVSDASGTARIAAIGASASIIGSVQFQRHYDITGRVYRYVSTPIFNTTVANWIAAGFRITGPFTGGSTGPNTSLWYYNDDAAGGAAYVAFPTTSASEVFTVGRGYSFFVYNGAATNKMILNGPIQQGNFTFPNLAAGTAATNNGWSLVGNPYASPIQWGTTGWTKNNIDETMYIRENDKPGETLVTDVKWWNAATSLGSDGYDGVIAQGQAFWVKSTTGSPSMVVSESAKANTLTAGFFRKEAPANYMSITMSKGTSRDKAYILFHEAAQDSLDTALDAIKLDNSYFNISSLSKESADLALNSLPASFCGKTIKLNVKSASVGSFSLNFKDLESFNYAVIVKLKDNFTQTETTITEGTVYNFDITSNPASLGNSRFELTIAKPELDQNAAFSASSANICDAGDATVTVNNTQLGVRYEILNGESVVGTFIGNGANATVILDKEKLSNGSNALAFRGGFDGCDQAVFTSTLNLSFVQRPVATLVDGVLVSSNATGNQWLLNGNIIPGATGVTFIPEESGDYTVTAFGNSCEVASDPVTFSITGTEDPDRTSFVLYPNPVKSKFTVKLPVSVRENKRADITLYNTAGVQVAKFRKTNRKEGIELNGEALTSGLYTIKVEADGQLLERKLVRE